MSEADIPIGGLNCQEPCEGFEHQLGVGTAPEDLCARCRHPRDSHSTSADGPEPAEFGTERAATPANHIGALEAALLDDVADICGALRKMGAERTALCAQVERQIIALRDGQRDKADLRANIQTIGEECDALQKRINAARAWIRAARDGADMADLLAILEGRKP